MTWDISKLNKCGTHGHHAGRVCPLCNGQADKADDLSTTEVIPNDAPVYDRSNWHRGPETELHGWFETEMGRLGVEIIHSRMDKESTIEKGWPDFTCLRCGEDNITRACVVEFKSRNTVISKDQVKVTARLRGQRIPVLVTGDFREAVEFVKTHLEITLHP